MNDEVQKLYLKESKEIRESLKESRLRMEKARLELKEALLRAELNRREYVEMLDKAQVK